MNKYNDAAEHTYWSSVKYKEGNMFFKDDQQLRKTYQPWIRWLPCSILWTLQKRWYHGKGIENNPKRLALWLLFSTAIVVGLVLAWFHFTAPDYSYQHWRAIAHVSVPACTLPSVEEGGRETKNGGLVCRETGKLPTRSQTIAWESYVLWDSCYEYHSRYACDELND